MNLEELMRRTVGDERAARVEALRQASDVLGADRLVDDLLTGAAWIYSGATPATGELVEADPHTAPEIEHVRTRLVDVVHGAVQRPGYSVGEIVDAVIGELYPEGDR